MMSLPVMTSRRITSGETRQTVVLKSGSPVRKGLRTTVLSKQTNKYTDKPVVVGQEARLDGMFLC